MEYAKNQAEKGNKVLYLVFNKNLAANINRLITSPNLKVINIHALFGETIGVDSERLRDTPKEYFNYELPEAFCDYYHKMDPAERKAV